MIQVISSIIPNPLYYMAEPNILIFRLCPPYRKMTIVTHRSVSIYFGISSFFSPFFIFSICFRFVPKQKNKNDESKKSQNIFKRIPQKRNISNKHKEISLYVSILSWASRRTLSVFVVFSLAFLFVCLLVCLVAWNGTE